MQTWAFPALIEKLGDDDFLATFPDIPEVLTGGASLAEARENAADARLRELPERRSRGRG
jgi:predicted RNase H-like HicB family nuclease